MPGGKGLKYTPSRRSSSIKALEKTKLIFKSPSYVGLPLNEMNYSSPFQQRKYMPARKGSDQIHKLFLEGHPVLQELLLPSPFVLIDKSLKNGPHMLVGEGADDHAVV